jgi:hypothetical protein
MRSLIVALGSVSTETHGTSPGFQQDSIVSGTKTLNDVDKED